MMSLRQRQRALVPAALPVSAALIAFASVASAGVTLLDFSWTSSANTSQVAMATCEDSCPGGLAICTATEPSFFESSSTMSEIDAAYFAGRTCANSCGDSLQASASSGVSTHIAVKPPLVAGQTQLWNFAHSITTAAEAALTDNGCGTGSASATTAAFHSWNLAFRVDQLTELTMNYRHSAMREGGGTPPTSDWTIRNSDGVAIFEQHLGGQLGVPSEQGILVWNLPPGDYTMQIVSSIDGLAVANGPVAGHSAAASAELVFRPFECSRVAAQTFDQTISSNDDLTLGVIVDPLSFGREYQWQLQSPVPPFAWSDISNGTFYLTGRDRVVPLGEAYGATGDTFFIDLDPEFANLLSGARFRCKISDDCGLLFSRPVEVTVTDGASTCAACPADYDQDGGISGNDIAVFFSEYEISAPCADVDADGGITASDVMTFFNSYEAGGC